MAHESAKQGFAAAAKALKRFHNINVSENTVRHVVEQEGRQIQEFLKKEKTATEDFRESDGVTETTVDGVMVNTYVEEKGADSWREMKVALVSKREVGASCSPETMDSRKLPSPKAVCATAAIESSEEFGLRWAALLKRCHVFDFPNLHVLADGARWIWNMADKYFYRYQGCLDFYHASQTLYAAVKEMYDDPEEQNRKYQTLRTELLYNGWSGLQQELNNLRLELPSFIWEEFGEKLYKYFSKQAEHLNYSSRLQDGYSIGSGQVEGANKQLVTRRLKQTGARWRIRHANEMVSLLIAYRYNTLDKYWLYCYNNSC